MEPKIKVDSRIKNKNYNLDKLYMKYWESEFNSKKI